MDVCVCVYVCVSNRFSEIPVSRVAFPFSLSPRALVLRPAREGLETRVDHDRTIGEVSSISLGETIRDCDYVKH